MVQERKCILCQMVYCSRKEMDEHMRSMLHHRELENLRGRDCNHECRVCRVTVVGLSTYAKHISSQLHKDKVYAREKEGVKEDEEEEYFDKELIELINQRREQSQPDDACSFPKDKEYRRRDERLPYQGMNQQDWQRDLSERSWQWQKESFNNPRQNYLHPSLGLNSNRHLPGPRGRAGLHMNSQNTRQLVHVRVEGSWHSNAGGATSWHQRGLGRGFHWQPDGNGTFPNQHPRNCGGNMQPYSYNNNQWNFGVNVETFPQGRNWPQRHCDTGLGQDPGWSKKSNVSNNFCKERWKKAENVTSSTTVCANLEKKASSKTDDFTSDNHSVNFIDFRTSDRSDSTSSKTQPAQSSEKNSLTKDKQHRWSPYPSQKATDQNVPPAADKNTTPCSEETKSAESQADQNEGLAKQKAAENIVEQSIDKSSDFTDQRSSRMPSLKSPLRNIPEVKTLALKRDQKNPLKGVKMLFPPFGDRPSRLSALNLETIKSNCISKYRSAAKSTKNNEETQEGNNREPVETLREVLQKAKEMLRNSQAMRSSYSQSLNRATSDPQSGKTEATHESSQNGGSSDEILEDASDEDFFSNSSKMESLVTLTHNTSHKNVSLKADVGTKDLEKPTTNSNNSGPFIAMSTEQCSMNNESPDSGDNRNSHHSQDFNYCENFENVSDLELQKSAAHSSNQVLPELSKLGLPVSLQRDLTRHIGSRSKPGTHLPEPNLNNARRIRNKSGHRKSDGDKDSGLKPTLRQILNVSRRNINWEQVMQQVTKKRQEQGKGLPRFGIEMVAQVQSEQDGLDFDEESDLGIESFHWEGITASPLGPVRKRSLSESSVAVERYSVYNLFNSHTSETSGELNIPTPQLTPTTSGPKVSSTLTSATSVGNISSSFPVELPATTSSRVSNTRSYETSQSQRENEETCVPSDSSRMLQSSCVSVVATVSSHVDGGTDSCASSTEQNDNQGVGKKRRANRDGSSPETSNLERDSKRRKIREKKERSQVDQLLSISLKEEELSNSLQGVDNNLSQARAALQAAYLEVQRLMILKQQITMEMGTLRTQRIQILQGLQGTLDVATDAEEGGPQAVSSRNVVSLQLETPPCLITQTPAGSLLPAPPAPVLPFTPAAILPAPATTALPDSSIAVKQEPVSPKEAKKSRSTPPLPHLQAAAPPKANNVDDQNTSVYPVITASMSLAELTSKFPVLNAEASNQRQYVSSATSPPPTFSAKEEVDIPENPPAPVPSTHHSQSLPCRTSPKGTDCLVAPSEHVDSTLISANSKAGKKKKKLRKKKTLRAAHVPENSDTEQDVSKPVRKLKCRKLSKDSTVSTSTPLEADAASREAEMNKDDNASDSSIEMMELPNPRFEVVEIDSNDEKPDSPNKADLADCPKPGRLEKNDEVTSTSELGTNYAQENLGSVERRAPTPGTKNSSEVSSDLGEDETPTEGSFEGHKASVNAIQVYCGVLYTCSADKSVQAYNLVTRKCMAVFEGHTSKVNCLLVTHKRGVNVVLYTGSSDHTIRCFNVQTKECLDIFNLKERVLCLHSRGKILYAGLANGAVVTFSIKSNTRLDVFECHGPRAVSCLATAQEGARKLLLVGSYDCTISVRDARNGLLLRTLEGHTKTVLCMKVVNDLVFSGSSDQSVHAHNIHTGELVRIYKGHNHAVTVVNILGQVMVTACLDKYVRVYELQSHDRLQVYGGYSDMIMCMSIYRSVIYTGCYDGSVQAVRLNPTKNYRCMWHGCSLIFGVVDHLKQHLLNDHMNPNFQTFKCRWKNCDGFFTSRRGSKQDAIGHIERHAEKSQMNK